MSNIIPPPFPHQVECYERFRDSSYIALFADMGVGKSRMIIDIVTHKVNIGRHNRLVVIAPVAVHPQWVSEQLPIHCAIPWKGYSFKSGKLVKDIRERDKFMFECRESDDLRVFTINYESFIRSTGHDVIDEFCSTSKLQPIFVLDEASRIKSPEAKTVKSIMLLRDKYPGSWRAVVTGTPASKSPVDMYSIFNFLKDRYMKCSFQAFQHEYTVQVDRKMKVKNRLITIRGVMDAYSHDKIRRMIAKNTVEGKLADVARRYIRSTFGLSEDDLSLISANKELTMFKNTERLQEKIAPDTFSVSKADCLKLPDKVYKEIVLKLSAPQKKLIKQLSKHAVAEHEGDHITVSQKALLGTRVLQICGGFMPHHTDIDGEYDVTPIKCPNAKLKHLLGDIDELGGAQFIVWSAFSAECEMLARELNKKCRTIAVYGATENKDRVGLLQQFKDGDAQCLVSNPTVCGYGLNLHFAGIQYYYSRDYRTEARLQAEDRSHRAGITDSPVYIDLLYDIPFERAVLASLKKGKDLNSQFVTMSLGDILNT